MFQRQCERVDRLINNVFTARAELCLNAIYVRRDINAYGCLA